MNSELKEQFMERTSTVPTTMATLKSTFALIEEIELDYGKDLAEMNKEEITRFLNDPRTGSFSTISSRLSYLRNYAKHYASTKGVPVNEFLVGLTPKKVKELLDNKDVEKPITKKTLNEWIDKMVNPRDKAITLGYYEGIGKEGTQEMLEIQPEDIDDDAIYLRGRGEKVFVSPQLISYFRAAMKKDEYVRVNVQRTNREPLVDKEIALKIPLSNRKNTARSNNLVLKRLANYLDANGWLNAQNLRRWGLAQFIIDKAEANDISLKSAYTRYKSEAMAQFGMNRLSTQTEEFIQRLYEAEQKEREKLE